MAETSKTVHQALLALRSLRNDGPASATELARRLALSRTVTTRLLATLDGHHYVRRTPEGWDLGYGLLDLAAGVGSELRDAARPQLADLADRLGETAILSIREGGDAVAIDQVVPAGRVMRVHYHPGQRHSLRDAAHGRAMLGFDDTPGLSRRLRRELARVRTQGYATSQDELEHGVSGIAAPVFAPDRVALAAIGVVAPTARMPSNAADTVVAAAAAITAQLDRSDIHTGGGPDALLPASR